MPDFIKGAPRKIITVQNPILSVQNNAQESISIYLIFHLALEEAKQRLFPLFTVRSAV